MNRIRLLALVVLLGPVGRSRAEPLTAVEPVTRTLAERLRESGRAEVQIERLVLDPISGRTQAALGLLVLEPPDRAAIEFPATGERVTLRADGGEWLQPDLRQMIRLDAGDAAGASRWWELLLRPAAAGFAARRKSERRWTLIALAHAGLAADSASMTLAADGLPLRLEISEPPAGHEMYRFRGWKFSKPRGRAPFVIRPPRDFEVVRLH